MKFAISKNVRYICSSPIQDLVTHLIAAPQAKLNLVNPTTTEQVSKIAELTEDIKAQINNTKKVVVLVGELVERYHLQTLVQQFLQNSGLFMP